MKNNPALPEKNKFTKRVFGDVLDFFDLFPFGEIYDFVTFCK